MPVFKKMPVSLVGQGQDPLCDWDRVRTQSRGSSRVRSMG